MHQLSVWVAGTERDEPSAEEPRGCRVLRTKICLSREDKKGNLKFQEHLRSSQGSFGIFCNQVAWVEFGEERGEK